MATNKTNTNSYQLTVSGEKVNLGTAIVEELVGAGVSVEDLSIMGPESRFIGILSQIFDNTSNAMDVMYRESSVTLASRYSSLFSLLSQHDMDISLAHPSKMEMFVRIPLVDILTLGNKVSSSTYEFQYTNANTVVVDGREFTAENDVYYIRTQELTDTYKTKVHYFDSNGARHLLPVQMIFFNGEYYILFSTNFLQITREAIPLVVGNVNLQRWVVETKENIHSFTVTYQSTQNAPAIELTPRNYYSRGQGNFIEYRMDGNRSMILEHKKTPGGFTPEINGIITVNALTTTGTNVKFKGVAKAKDVDPIELNVFYEPVGEYFESIGGRLADTTKEVLREDIIKKKGARGRIDTEMDMSSFLLGFGGKSIFYPKLIINDVKMRVFNVYTALKFGVNVGVTNERAFTIPTNSLDIEVDLTQLPTKNIDGKPFYCLNPNIAIKSTQGTEADHSVPLYGGWASEPTEEQAIANQTNSFLYRTPLILSYSKKENFVRSYIDGQDDIAYRTAIISENDDDRIPTHIINTSLRVHDYEEYEVPGPGKKRVFKIKTEIRSDNTEIPLSIDPSNPDTYNFKATLTMKLQNGSDVEVKLSEFVDQEEDNKYTLTFDFVTDRNIFDKFVDIQYIPDGGNSYQTVTVPVQQKMKLNLFYKVGSNFEEISVYEADVSLFRDVTQFFLIQSVPFAKLGGVGNDIKFLLVPCIGHYFYEVLENRPYIIDEINRVVNFLNEGIYGELDQYRSHGFTLRELQETLFTVSIKFARTYGRSRFLQAGATVFTPLMNLQIRPTIYLRVLEDTFDKQTISEYLDDQFTKHEFLTSDLHMSTHISSILEESGGALELLQMINFDRYKPDYHMIKHNGRDEKNDDVPEILSIAPKYNKQRGTHEYDVTYVEI